MFNDTKSSEAYDKIPRRLVNVMKQFFTLFFILSYLFKIVGLICAWFLTLKNYMYIHVRAESKSKWIFWIFKSFF